MDYYGTYEEPEGELDLAALLWDLLSQWKAILIVALVLALAIPGLKLIKDGRAYSSAQAAQKEQEAEQGSMSAEERREAALEGLSAKDRQTVEYLAQEQELVNAQKSYLENSVLMNTNPVNQRILLLSYLIQANDGSELQPLASAYASHLRNEPSLAKVGEALGLDADPSYIGELITTSLPTSYDSASTSLVITINVALPSEADATVAEQAIDEVVQHGHDALASSVGEHEIRLVSNSETYQYNADAVNRKTSAINNVNTMQGIVTTAATALTEEQKAAFDTLVTLMKEEDTEGNGMGAGTPGAMTEDAADKKIAAEKPRFSLKFAAVGFVAGVFVYAIAYVLWVIMRKRVASAEDLQAYSVSRVLGEIYYSQKYTGMNKLLHSKIVEQRRYAKRGDVATQAAKTVSTATSVFEHAKASDVTMLCVDCAEGRASMIAKGITKELNAAGVAVRMLDVTGGVDEKALLSVQHAVIMASHQAKTSDVWHLTELCQSYDVQRLGCVYISEY